MEAVRNREKDICHLAIVQMAAEPEPERTYAKAEARIAEAAANGADIVVLPEMWNCPYADDYFRRAAEQGHQEAAAKMAAWAARYRVLLVGGSVVEVEDRRLYNTCFVFGSDGRQLARHRKVHLFDVDLPEMQFRESDTFTPGEEVTVFDTPFGRCGAAVCFDVRFPELFRAMARRGAKLLFLPAQFNRVTGPAHWELSVRMRALDNEVFVAAAAAARQEGAAYQCWGHSMVADPFGQVAAACGDEETILYQTIDLRQCDDVRRRLPTFLHLREDVYTVAE